MTMEERVLSLFLELNLFDVDTQNLLTLTNRKFNLLVEEPIQKTLIEFIKIHNIPMDVLEWFKIHPSFDNNGAIHLTIPNKEIMVIRSIYQNSTTNEVLPSDILEVSIPNPTLFVYFYEIHRSTPELGQRCHANELECWNLFVILKRQREMKGNYRLNKVIDFLIQQQ